MSLEDSLNRIATALEALAGNGVPNQLEVGAAKPEAARTPTTAATAVAQGPKADSQESKALDYEKDIKPLFNEFCKVKGITEAQAYLTKRGYTKKLTEAKPEEYPEIIAELKAAIAS